MEVSVTPRQHLMTPEAFIDFTGLELRPSTLDASRTSGELGGSVAPPFVIVASKPYYRQNDTVQWLEELEAYPCNAQHKATCVS